MALRIRAVVGDDLLGENFPLIHAVRRAADRAPRLIDMRGASRRTQGHARRQGVTFDTGGLDIA
jgi:leucyl aminopeptidase